MSGLSEILINIERERYKLIEEVKYFEKLKEEFELLTDQAESDPVAAQRLEQFHRQYGNQFLQEVTKMTTQIKTAEAQYKSFLRMVNPNSKSVAVDIQPVSIPKGKKAPGTRYI